MDDSERSEPTVTIRNFTCAERRQIGEDYRDKAAEPITCTQDAFASKDQPEYRTFRQRGERLRDEKVCGSRMAKKERRQNQNYDWIRTRGQPDTAHQLLRERNLWRQADQQNRCLDQNGEQIADRQECPQIAHGQALRRLNNVNLVEQEHTFQQMPLLGVKPGSRCYSNCVSRIITHIKGFNN